MLSYDSAVAENQPANKHRMYPELSNFATRLRERIHQNDSFKDFDATALELFRLQFEHNGVYQHICQLRGLTSKTVADWKGIPSMPAFAFKELNLTCLAAEERLAVFYSSGTTEQQPSRHFHCAESLAVYEASLWHWFKPHFTGESDFLFLTPTSLAAPNSSLVHMFETVRRQLGLPASAFVGEIGTDAAWVIDFSVAIHKLQAAVDAGRTTTLLGTAFSFVHLLDYLAEKGLRFSLPSGSRVMETGGYKNRSRTMPKSELHALITDRLGVQCQDIICEYGMSELSSQAYDVQSSPPSSTLHPRIFRFPPWARVQITSPETGHEVKDGETGLIRIFDLANIFSVAAIQTEDLGVRRGDGFELVGRAQLAEPRGCSLMTA